MKRILLLAWTLSAPWLAQAADLPNVVNENQASTAQLCVERAADECVSSICTNSPDINCTRTCQSSAEAKCKGMSAE